jgi:hypothetical protein
MSSMLKRHVVARLAALAMAATNAGGGLGAVA